MSKQYFHFPNSYDREGVDHINISYMSDLYIGRVFEPSFRRVIKYPYIGKFNSVFNLWSWLKSDPLDDGIRRLNTHRLQELFRDAKFRNSYVPNFKCIIAYATYLKIKNDKMAMGEIRKLPKDVTILSYTKPKGSDIRICSEFANIIVPIVNEIIAAVHENREPDFFDFQERGVSTDLKYLEPVLSSRLKGMKNVCKYIGKTKPLQNTASMSPSLPINLKQAK